MLRRCENHQCSSGTLPYTRTDPCFLENETDLYQERPWPWGNFFVSGKSWQAPGRLWGRDKTAAPFQTDSLLSVQRFQPVHPGHILHGKRSWQAVIKNQHATAQMLYPDEG